MSEIQNLVNFSQDKECVVCNSTPAYSTVTVVDNEAHIAPVCLNNVCRYNAVHNVDNILEAAKEANKLLHAPSLNSNDQAVSSNN